MRILTAVPVLALLMTAVGAAGPRGSILRLMSNTGAVTVDRAGETRLVPPGPHRPVALPEGSEINVLAGRARFEGCGLTLLATEGDSFALGRFPDEDCRDPISIAATGESTAIEARIGDARLLLTEGDAIQITPVVPGRFEVQDLSGLIEVGGVGRVGYLQAGQTLAVGAEEPRTLAPGSAAREELRSAVGAKPFAAPAAPPGALRAARPSPLRSPEPEPPLLQLALPLIVIGAAAGLVELRIRRDRELRRKRARLLEPAIRRHFPLI